mgnify:CR=1 FL=1
MSTGQAVATALAAAQHAAATGVRPAIDDVVTLLSCRGDDLAELQSVAARLRDEGLARAGRAGRITYSRKVFIPLTRLCRDRCHYCTFVTVPGKLRREGHGMYLEIDQVVALARQGAALGCKEALFTLGDRPEDRWPEAAQWLAERGFVTVTFDYVGMGLSRQGPLRDLQVDVIGWGRHDCSAMLDAVTAAAGTLPVF